MYNTTPLIFKYLKTILNYKLDVWKVLYIMLFFKYCQLRLFKKIKNFKTSK